MAYLGTFSSLPPRARGEEGDTAVYQQKTGSARGKVWHVIKWGGQWRTIGQIGEGLVKSTDIESVTWGKVNKADSDLADLATRSYNDLQDLPTVSPAAFGEMWVNDNTTADTSSGIAGTYTQITRFDQTGLTQDMTVSVLSNYIQATNAGTYKIQFKISFSGAPVTVWQIAAFHVVPGVSTTEITKSTAERALGAGGDVGSASGHCLRVLAAGDRIDLRITETSAGNKSYTVHWSNLIVTRVL